MLDKIDEVIKRYNSIVKNVDSLALSQSERAYGGMLRSEKGKLVESIATDLIEIAWKQVHSRKSITINSTKIRIPIQEKYIKSIKNNIVREYMQNNLNEYYYGLSVDKQVFIDGELVLGMECKAYCENAMIKRIMIDFHLLRTLFPNMSCFLLQLESQLGGDYAGAGTMGSAPTHTIMSFFDFSLHILTLLQGERQIDKPIHKFFKPLKRDAIENAIEQIKETLASHI